jgi:16S rRNA (adenine1518-N6/adenine1519-N6)-dimethyltransferase
MSRDHPHRRPSDPIHSKKRLGQNFLVDTSVVDRIIQAVRPRSDETIIEIGPGQGALTKRLVEKAGNLIAIEFDRDLIAGLRAKFSGEDNFRLVEADALVTDFCRMLQPATSARVVANLPYNIATAILQRLIEQRNCITEMILMLQREVVERMTAPPGSSERGFLSLLVEAHCDAEKLFDVSPSAFRPAPKVWSSVISLTIKHRLAADVTSEELMWQVVSAGFAQRRKTILNNLRNAPAPLGDVIQRHGGASIVLCGAEVELQRRAETLTLAEWERITTMLL